MVNKNKIKGIADDHPVQKEFDKYMISKDKSPILSKKKLWRLERRAKSLSGYLVNPDDIKERDWTIAEVSVGYLRILSEKAKDVYELVKEIRNDVK